MSEIHRAGVRAPKAPQGSFIALYRTILEDGSRYRTLGPNARLAFLSLKLLMPFANIERRASWPAEIADASGLSEDQARAAISEMTKARIIEHDGNVLWIVQGLACEPSAMSAQISPALVKGLRRHIDNLGASKIVRRFRMHYASVIGSAGDPSPDGSGDPSPDPSREGSVAFAGAVGSSGKKGKKISGTTKKPRAKKPSAPAVDQVVEDAVRVMRALYPRRKGATNLAVGERRLRDLIAAREVQPHQVRGIVSRYAKSVEGSQFIQQASTFWSEEKATWREYLPESAEEQELWEQEAMADYDV